MLFNPRMNELLSILLIFKLLKDFLCRSLFSVFDVYDLKNHS